MNNLSDETLTYTLTSSSLTEGIVTQDGVKFSDQVSTRLEEDDFTVSYSGSTVEDGVVTVPANGTATVDVTIQLSDSYLSELRENFENGNFCEGYIYLQPTDGVELVIPYLGFVGDWVTAGTTFEGDPGSDYSLAPTNFATVNLTGAGLFLGEDAVYTGPKSYNYDRLAFSPKIAGEQQFLAMQLGIRRNVMDFEVSISDEEGNKVWSLGADYLRKCYYNTNTGSVSQAQVLTDGWNGRYQDPETGEYTGDYAPAGQYYLTLEGYVGQQSDVKTSKTYPIWLDGSAPEVSKLQCYVDENDRNENGEGKFKLAFDVKDDHFVRTVIVNDSTGTWRLTYSDADFKNHSIQQGETTKVVMDLDELCQYLADNGLNPGRIKLQISDYSLNYRVVYVDLGPQYLNVANATVAVGDSLQMEYRVLPLRLADTLKLAWTSSDETIATVDENGVVTGVAKGQCYITAKAESGLSATATLTVGDETLPPEQPEVPDPNAPVDYPSAEELPIIWNDGVTASPTEELNERFEADGLWYKVTGADTVQLVRNPGVTNDYANPYPEIPAELVIPETVTNSETGKTYTVTSIGYRALYMASQLTSITLPDSIRVIGDQAFLTGWVSKVTSMNLPEGLEEVGANALNSVKVDFRLPSTLKRIGELAFTGTAISSVHLADDVYVGSRAFGNCLSLKEVNLTRNTQDTEGIYMNCTALTDVTVEPDVTKLPQNAFFNCQSLTDIELPESVVEIGRAAFQGCKFTSLDCLNTGSVTTLGDFCFAGNNNLHDIVIPDSVTYVGEQQFRFCPAVRSVSFGENVAYVGDGVMSTFFTDPSVTKVVPEVRSATAGAAVRRSGYVGAMTKDGVNFDVYCGSSFILDGLTYMPISATEVQVTDYDESTVFGVVTIPETVTCEGDETVYTVTSVVDKLFSQKYNITEVHLPDTITTVGERAFDQIHGLNYINIPKSLTTLTGRQAFGYGGWDNLEAGEWLVDTLYVLASLETWNVSAFSGNKYTTAVLEDGLHMVGSYGISNNAKLTDVKMASTVQFLKNNAFSSCEALESIELPEGLLYIGDQAFRGDPLKSVTLPGSLKYVGTQAFESLKYDYSTYPSTVTYVGASEITLGGGVTGLGWNAFYKDAKLTAVLGSQQNLLVERCDFTETPDVVWDGKTSIPAGDWSRVPAGTTVTVSGSVRIDGTLIIEDGAKVEVAPGGRLNIGMDAEVDQSKISWIYVPTVPAEPEQPAFRFKDVQDENAFYFAPVYWAVEQGITNGVTADLFQPNGTCTRGQAVTFLWRAAGSPEPKGTEMPFTDVASGSYCEKAVLWAVENGITNGTTATTFSPNAGCTRAQIVALICRSQQGTPAAGDLPFTDAPAWAYDAIAWSYQQGIVKGTTETTFSPNALCTRGQIVTFLYRALSK